MHIRQWNNKVLGKYWIWGRSETKALMERCAHWAPCFWLISPKWLTFQAKDMHIREWNSKVLGKSAIKKGGHFSRVRPFNTALANYLSELFLPGDSHTLHALEPSILIIYQKKSCRCEPKCNRCDAPKNEPKCASQRVPFAEEDFEQEVNGRL